MKKYNLIFTIAFCMAILCNLNKTFSQATSAGAAFTPNQPNTPAVDYLGWDNTVNVPVEIKHEADTFINFYTNAGAGTFLNMKMSIMRRTINGTERAGVGIHEVGTNPITLCPSESPFSGLGCNRRINTLLNYKLPIHPLPGF